MKTIKQYFKNHRSILESAVGYGIDIEILYPNLKIIKTTELSESEISHYEKEKYEFFFHDGNRYFVVWSYES